ncbi:MAG: terminase family protein [Opitutales bacterium]|nr:terminase family protein [Opitutales bacterium]
MSKIRSVKAKCAPRDVNAVFLPYQVSWCADRSRIKLIEKSRQIGMSWATANDIVSQAIINDSKYDFWVSSRDEIQARLFLQDCKKFADGYQKMIKALASENIYKDEAGKPYTSFDLKFYNGRVIHSMSSNADAQAGKRGTRVLDEFALHPDPISLYAIAYPGITWGGQMAIISTHRGENNFFNKLILEARENGNPKKISIHRVTLEDALNQGLLFKLQQNLPPSDPRQDMDETDYFNDVKSQCADIDSFNQEYMCIPSSDNAVFLSYDILQGCLYKYGEIWQTDLANCAGGLYIGVDVGRTTDLTVIWVLEKISGVYFTRRVVEMKNVKFAEQEAVLYGFLRLPNVRKCHIDQTGIGRQFAERAEEKFGKIAQGITFTAGAKEELAYPLRAAFEDKIIKIPDSGEILVDLRSVRKKVSSSGRVLFDAAHSEKGHADRFWALALALNSASCGGASTQTNVIPRSTLNFIW